jgi:plastocyanin
MKTVAILASATFAAPAVAAHRVDAAAIEVHLKAQNFEPKAVSAKPGDTIVFYNDDDELHSVFSPDAAALVPEHFIDPHTKYEAVIPAGADPGPYNLVCTVHLMMKGTLRIVK